MRTLFATALLAATAAVAAPAAHAQQVELVTGIGFGHSQVQAMQNAVRAWINQAHRDYGSADWNAAYKGPMSCSQQTGEPQFGTQGIGVEGDVSGRWSCSVTGLPMAALGG